MTATMHVGPEEVMAWVDGELPESEARVVAAHVEECAGCAAVAEGFRRMAAQLGEWRVEEVPGRVDAVVMERVGRVTEYPHGRLRRTWGTRRWAMGLGAVAAVLLLAVVPSWYRGHEPMQSKQFDRLELAAKPQPMPNASSSDMEASLGPMKDVRAGASVDKASAPSAAAENAPMIARTVSLTVQVKDAGQGRAAVEALLLRHHGYAAQMNANSVQGAARAFTASLRIPAAELPAALKELRALGKVESESQSGEEVTQQYQDLVARLKNSREEETRLQAILAQRTGRISDVLEVEQEIARVRGEIESMEAEQAGLEHRVDFASVELTLEEEYKAEFRAPDSVGMRLRNALVEGLGNARDTVLGMVLFAEEYGPALLVWGILLALPGVWVWRRYRRALR